MEPDFEPRDDLPPELIAQLSKAEQRRLKGEATPKKRPQSDYVRRRLEQVSTENFERLIMKQVQGPYYAVIEPDGRLRQLETGMPCLFDKMGPYDNHTTHGRKVVRVMLRLIPAGSAGASQDG